MSLSLVISTFYLPKMKLTDGRHWYFIRYTRNVNLEMVSVFVVVFGDFMSSDSSSKFSSIGQVMKSYLM